MALVVEDGTGVTGAESYVSVSDADTYITNMGYTTPAWSSLSEAEKEQAIRRAMSYIESFQFKGQKEDKDNALEWPRIGVYDRNDYAVDEDSIPDALKKAVIEAAFREQTLGTLQGDLEGSSNVRSMKAGNLSLEYFEGRAENAPVFQIINGLLMGLIEDWARVLRT